MAQNEKFDNKDKVTWGDLKNLIETAGINDKDEIDRIDVAWGNPTEVKIQHDDDYGWQVYL